MTVAVHAAATDDGVDDDAGDGGGDCDGDGRCVCVCVRGWNSVTKSQHVLQGNAPHLKGGHLTKRLFRVC